MSSKIDIKEIHENFHLLFDQREELIGSNYDENLIDEIDDKLKEIIVNGIKQGILFSSIMQNWKPFSKLKLRDYNTLCQVDMEGKFFTIPDALIVKNKKEKKFKQIQNLSMLACTILLIFYYLIVGWWI